MYSAKLSQQSIISSTQRKYSDEIGFTEEKNIREKTIFEKFLVTLEEPFCLIILLKPQRHFSFPRVTAAVIASLFLKMKCHTLTQSAVINEIRAQIL